MFLHELSRSVAKGFAVRVESDAYAAVVRSVFGNDCPYCNLDLTQTVHIVEHLDGMNRYRVGLHIPGNVLVACRKCNNEKRRDDSLKQLTLAATGWESFLSHVGRCNPPCGTCRYWNTVWPNQDERLIRLTENKDKIQLFRSSFPESSELRQKLSDVLPKQLATLYSDCQAFAQFEIDKLLLQFVSLPDDRAPSRGKLEVSQTGQLR